MKRIIRTLAIMLPMLLIASNSYAAVKAGSACSKVGSKSVSGGKSYTCIKSGKKLVWDKGVLVPVAKPAPSATQVAKSNEIPVVSASKPDPQLSSISNFDDSQECRLLSQSNPNDPNLGSKRSERFIKTTGDVNVALIFVYFKDAKATQDAINFWKTKMEPNTKQYYQSSSYGKLNLTFTSTYKFYSIDRDSTYYNLDFDPHTGGVNPAQNPGGLISDAADAAKSDYDFSKSDILEIVFPNNARIGINGALGIDLSIGGKRFTQAIASPMDMSLTNKMPTGQTGILHDKWLVHELGHSMGLIHPYDTFNLSAKSGNLFAIPAWDVMGYDNGIGPDLLAWEKFILGWIQPNQINCLVSKPKDSLTIFLEGIADSSSNSKMTLVKISSSEALVIESRRKSSIDKLKADQEGLLVYRINVNLSSNQGAVTVLYNNAKVVNEYPDPAQLVGTLLEGESIESDGILIKVIKHSEKGDFFTVSKV